MLPVQQQVENGQHQQPPGGDTAGLIFKKPDVGLRQRLSFDDFHIIEQVGEGTYGCVPSPVVFMSFSCLFHLLSSSLCRKTFLVISWYQHVFDAVIETSNKPPLRPRDHHPST
jgi:hypothetical protein